MPSLYMADGGERGICDLNAARICSAIWWRDCGVCGEGEWLMAAGECAETAAVAPAAAGRQRSLAAAAGGFPDGLSGGLVVGVAGGLGVGVAGGLTGAGSGGLAGGGLVSTGGGAFALAGAVTAGAGWSGGCT